MKILNILILTSLIGCTTLQETPHQRPANPTNYKERLGKVIEGCVVRLVREGIDEEVAFNSCYKIYGKCNK